MVTQGVAAANLIDHFRKLFGCLLGANWLTDHAACLSGIAVNIAWWILFFLQHHEWVVHVGHKLSIGDIAALQHRVYGCATLEELPKSIPLGVKVFRGQALAVVASYFF